jgi:hypothetical protein
MKKLFILLSALLFGTMMAQAQIVIKPAVGVNFTDLSKDATGGEFKARVGWQIGGSVMFAIKKFYLEPGVFYVQKSTKFNSSNNSVSDVNFDINGIRVPVTIGVNLADAKSTVNFRIFGGGSAFILTNTKNIDKAALKNASWGVYAGAGLDISVFFLDASYEWSLTNISDDLDNVDIGKSRSIFIQAGFRLRL